MSREKATPPATDQGQSVGNFQFEGKTYEILPTVSKVNVPGIGILTAGEILASPEAQAHLVKEKCFTIVGEVV